MDEKLTVKRLILKRQLTNFFNYARICEGEFTRLQEHYDQAPSIWRQFEEVHQEMEYALHDEGTQQAIEEHAQIKEKCESMYYEALATAQAKLKTLNIQQNEQAEDTLKLKLSLLTIQPFHGEYDKWLTFKDAFLQGVHSKNLPANQKFQVLQNLLRDKALEVIADLEASDANYAIAWELLRKRYENRRLIINTHVKALFELTPVTKSNHVSLRNMVDDVRTHIRSLQALRQPVEHWDTVVIYLMTSKFDNSTKEEWEKEISQKQHNQMPTLEEMLTFLNKRCLMLEKTDKSKSQTESLLGKKTDKKVMLNQTATPLPLKKSQHPLPSSVNILIKFFESICISNDSAIIASGPDILLPWLSLFLVYGDLFVATYCKYICDHDDEIWLTDDEAILSDLIFLSPHKEGYKFYRQDIKATCHLIMISINKTFSENVRDTQLNTYIKKRLSAVYSTLGCHIGKIKVHQNFFSKISSVLRTLPKLRHAMFFMLKYNQKIPEFATGIKLLAYSGMRTVTCMSNFIDLRLDQRTLAHSDPQIMEEIKLFIDTVNKKKAELGELYPYMRVLDLEDKDLNLNRFPNLAVASVHYYKTFGAETFQQLITPNMNVTVSNLLEKAITLDARYTYEDIEYTDNQKKVAEMIGLDLNKLKEWKANKRATREGTENNERNEKKSKFRVAGNSSNSED